MLIHGISGKFSGMVEAYWPSGSSSRRHASYFNTGFVTFVGKREQRIWWLGSYQMAACEVHHFIKNISVVS